MGQKLKGQRDQLLSMAQQAIQGSANPRLPYQVQQQMAARAQQYLHMAGEYTKISGSRDDEMQQMKMQMMRINLDKAVSRAAPPGDSADSSSGKIRLMSGEAHEGQNGSFSMQDELNNTEIARLETALSKADPASPAYARMERSLSEMLKRKKSQDETGGFGRGGMEIVKRDYRHTGVIESRLPAAAKLSVIKQTGIDDPNFDAASARMNYKANQLALDAAEKQYSTVAAFEQYTTRNGKKLLELANKRDQTGGKLINRWRNSTAREIFSSPDLAALDAQMDVYKDDISRLLTASGTTLAGQLTDTARKEVQSYLNSDFSAEAIERVVNVLQKDAESRTETQYNVMRQLGGTMPRIEDLNASSGGASGGGKTKWSDLK